MTNVIKMVEVEADAIAPAGSEEAFALEFASRHSNKLRFVALWGKWLRYDGVKWSFDLTRETWSMARELCREFAVTANKPAQSKAIASSKTRAAVVSLSGEDRKLAATIDQWDRDGWLLNTPEGVIDLRSGKSRPARPDDYITKATAVAPKKMSMPLWLTFLDRVTNSDVELQAFLQRMCGYALTGSTREHALFFLYGEGGNGKTVFMNTVTRILNDYHQKAPMETFTASKYDRHPTELALLRGARLVSASETEKGRRWAEAKIQMLTGGEDKVAARFMRQDFFYYTPVFKLMIYGNHKPGLRSVNEAMRRRFHLVPFTVTIADGEKIPDFDKKMEGEWPAIFAWMIEGCRQWRDIGLAPPKVVLDATKEYLESQDTLQRFIDDCCAWDRSQWTSKAELFEVGGNGLSTSASSPAPRKIFWRDSQADFLTALRRKKAVAKRARKVLSGSRSRRRRVRWIAEPASR